MKKISHRKANALLEAYTAQELPPVERQLVEAHLATCATCQRDLSEIQHISSMLRSFAHPAPIDIASTSHPSLSLPKIQHRSRRAAKQHYTSNPGTPRRLVTLIAALLSLAIIITTAAVFTYATQIPSSLSSSGTTPTPTAIPLCYPATPTPIQSITPTPLIPTATPTLAPTPTQDAPPSPTPSYGDNCASPTPIHSPTTIATPSPTPNP